MNPDPVAKESDLMASVIAFEDTAQRRSVPDRLSTAACPLERVRNGGLKIP
jgi:hypothetical protein